MKTFTDHLLAESENKYLSASIPYIFAAVLLVAIIVFSGTLWHFNKLQRNNSPAEASVPESSQAEQVDAEMQAGDSKTIAQQAAITQFLELRGQIMKELSGSLSNADLKLDIDSRTGAMRFQEADFFDSRSVVLKKSGQAILQKFVPVFSSVVLSDKYKGYIDEIAIEGHSSGEGDYFYNLALSRKRADAVAAYITGAKFPDYAGKKEIVKYLSTAGRSYTEPVMINGAINQQKSRRIEFRIRLKDDIFLSSMPKDSKGAN